MGGFVLGILISAALATDGPLQLAADVDRIGVTATVHFDRNATRQLLAFDTAMVQLTPAGIAILRDQVSLAPIGDIVTDSPIEVMGRDGTGAILLGCRDGSVHRLGTPTAATTDAGQLDGKPLWLGSLAGETWAVVVAKIEGAPDALIVQRLNGPKSSRIDVSKMRVVSAYPSAVAADAQGRLWLGWDYDAQGGALAWVEPASGRLHVMKDPIASRHGIHGFIANGPALLAYGGMSWNTQSAFVGPVTTSGIASLYDVPASGVAGPSSPISAVVPDGDGLIVVSGVDVWRTDAGLASWSRVTELIASRGAHRWTAGLGGAVTDAICEVGGSCLFGTAGAGLFRLRPDGVERIAATGQLPFDPKHLIAGTTGPIALAEPFAASWSGTAWEPVPIPQDLPPFPLTIAWLAAEDGALWRIDAEDVQYSPESHALVFSKWTASGADVVARVAGTTVGPDAIVGQFGGRWRGLQVDHEAALTRVVELDGGTWRPKGTASVANLASVEPVPGAPELVLDRAGGRLLTWTPAGLVPVDRPGLAAQRVVAALRTADGGLLVANPGALVRYGAGTDAAETLSYTEPGVQALAIDGCGRTWLAGSDALWMVDGGAARRVSAIDGLSGRAWIDLMGTPEGIAATDGTVVAELVVACPAK